MYVYIIHTTHKYHQQHFNMNPIYISEQRCMDALGPLTTIPSASVEETKVKSPLVGENCMADSDYSTSFTHNHTPPPIAHLHTIATFNDSYRSALGLLLAQNSHGGSRKFRKNTSDTSNPGAERNGESRAPPSARNEHRHQQQTYKAQRRTAPPRDPFAKLELHMTHSSP